MRCCTTLSDVAVIGGQSHDFLAVFGHVQRLPAILVHVGYHKMIARYRTTSRTTSCDVEAHPRYLCNGRAMTSYDFIYDVRRRKTQSRIVRHSLTVIQSSYDHRATLIYKIMLASHHAIIVMSYVIVRLSYDYRSTIVRCRTIYICFSFSPSNHSGVVCHRTTIVRLSYDVVRFTYDFTDIIDVSQTHRVRCDH